MLAILVFALCLGVDFSLAERNITGKIAVVTGGARGIGRAIVDNFLKNGAQSVIIVDYNETSGTEAAETLGCEYGEDRVEFVYCDIRTDLEDTFEYIMGKYKYVDILVNDAGVLNETDPKATLDTNIVALVKWSLKFREAMRTDQNSSCSEFGKGGFILNIASINGHTEAPFFPVYSASKFGVIGFTRSVGHLYNYEQTGVAVVAICPSNTRTAMTEHMVVPDYQQEVWNKFLGSLVQQEPDAVGRGAVEVYTNAESGTIWDVAAGADPVTASALTVITYEQLVSA